MTKKPTQQDLGIKVDAQGAARSGPVECLGMTFANDDERRKHFLELLRQKLNDTEFRKIEGFPVGTDEAILALSDPPYYTACPNPWLGEFVQSHGQSESLRDDYSKEPLSADVSEGKRDLIYGVHAYHAKVPHRAVMRYILHYTRPGDVVLDGFAGTGMSGVAAQLCGCRTQVQSLGFSVTEDGDVQDHAGESISKIGVRHAILQDLSPAATFIASNYNRTQPPAEYGKTVRAVLDDVRHEFGWMYETTNPQTGAKEEMVYCVWSDVFSCPECSKEIVFWDAAVDHDDGSVEGAFRCRHCLSQVSKTSCAHVFESVFDPVLGRARKSSKFVPVEVCCRALGSKRQYSRKIHQGDLDVIARSKELRGPPHPVNPMMFRDGAWGDQWRKGYHSDVTHDYHFYLKRPLLILGAFSSRIGEYRPGRFLMTASMLGLTRLQRYAPGSTFPNMIRSGTLYIGSLHREWNALAWMEGKLRSVEKFYRETDLGGRSVFTSTASATQLRGVPSGSVDYVFVDPPFGSNLAYSELNFLWEGWLGVFTNTQHEAIVSKSQSKDLLQYGELMSRSFVEYHRVLKPGRWMTVEFHNSKNSVWNVIQEAIQRAGFVVADVSLLDKKQKGFNAINAPGAVNQDLVISAYKPTQGFEASFRTRAGTQDGAWEFVRNHLNQLPVSVVHAGKMQVLPERQQFVLYDRMVAFHVQRGLPVPVSASEFYALLSARFPERDDMYFLPEQAGEYDRKRMQIQEVGQIELIPRDEESAIRWLREELKLKPRPFSDLAPDFMRVVSWEKHEKTIELSEILDQNFLCYDGNGDVPSQIHSYLSTNWPDLRKLAKGSDALCAKAKGRWYVPDPNKAGDLEKIREKALLREFWEYLPDGYAPAKPGSQDDLLPGFKAQAKIPKGKRLAVIRLEAVRAGFKYCWQNKDYQTIIAVARRIPEDVLQEDPKLLMWYDQAMTRMGEAV